MADRTFVSIAIPVLNEENFIREAVESILPCDATLDYEVLILDGGSTDGTPRIVQELARANPRIKLHRNDNRIQSAAMNLAARIADPAARVIVRADCHAIYPERFVETCLTKLAASDAQSVVVTMDTVGKTCFQRGVAAAQNSLLGNGGSAHRRQSASGFVDHGHHAAFDRAFFQAVGGYDETISTNEDFELDTRIARAGGRIWLESSVPVRYFPRDTIGRLFRQYLRHGRGRAETYLRHRYRLKLRQMIPAVVLVAISLGALMAVIVHPIFAAIPLGYAAMCLGWGLARATALRDPCVAFMGVAAMTMHIAWAIGFLGGLSAKQSRRLQAFERPASHEARN